MKWNTLMKKIKYLKIFTSLVVTSVLINSTISRAGDVESAVWINKGDRAPTDGYLIPEPRFHDATIQMLDLKICEQRLLEKDCGDNLTANAKAFHAGLISFGIAFVAYAMIKPKIF